MHLIDRTNITRVTKNDKILIIIQRIDNCHTISHIPDFLQFLVYFLFCHHYVCTFVCWGHVEFEIMSPPVKELVPNFQAEVLYCIIQFIFTIDTTIIYFQDSLKKVFCSFAKNNFFSQFSHLLVFCAIPETYLQWQGEINVCEKIHLFPCHKPNDHSLQYLGLYNFVRDLPHHYDMFVSWVHCYCIHVFSR